MKAEIIHNSWLEETLSMNGSVLPYTLYRFVSAGSDHDKKTRDRFFENTRALFLENKIWLSTRNAFNDPFDCRPYLQPPSSSDEILNFWRSLRERHSVKTQLDEIVAAHAESPNEFLDYVKSSVENSLDSVGIRSFSSKIDSTLMWAHYASSYTGMAFVFAHARNGIDFGALPVRYQKQYPSISSTDMQLLPYQLLVKGLDWSYENEWRLVESKKANMWHALDPRSIRGVVFGPMTDIEVVGEVIEIAKQRSRNQMQPVRIYGTEFCDGEFRLDFFELTNDGNKVAVDLPVASCHPT
jgi:hypothetical protein